jgi:hypothetical protein
VININVYLRAWEQHKAKSCKLFLLQFTAKLLSSSIPTKLLPHKPQMQDT